MSDDLPPSHALVLYDQAVKNIVACKTLIESKYWMGFAEAKALLGKMTKDRRVEVEGKRLRLLAYRKANEMAEQLRPTRRGTIPGDGRRGGSPLGAKSLLMEHGFSSREASDIRKIGSLPEKTFNSIIESRNPPSPTTVRPKYARSSDSWRAIIGDAGLREYATFCKRHAAKALARGMVGDEVAKAGELAEQASLWLEEFTRYLPKVMERK